MKGFFVASSTKRKGSITAYVIVASTALALGFTACSSPNAPYVTTNPVAPPRLSQSTTASPAPAFPDSCSILRPEDFTAQVDNPQKIAIARDPHEPNSCDYSNDRGLVVLKLVVGSRGLGAELWPNWPVVLRERGVEVHSPSYDDMNSPSCALTVVKDPGDYATLFITHWWTSKQPPAGQNWCHYSMPLAMLVAQRLGWTT